MGSWGGVGGTIYSSSSLSRPVIYPGSGCNFSKWTLPEPEEGFDALGDMATTSAIRKCQELEDDVRRENFGHHGPNVVDYSTPKDKA